MEPRIGIAAGMIKSHRHLPERLLQQGLISHVTVGSYTLQRRDGNSEPTTWVSPDGSWMLNAIGLKNEGLLDFLDNELVPMHEVCYRRTKLRVSLAPTEAGELRDMIIHLNEHCVAELIDELEINAACPNHKKGAHIEPVLAYDAEAVEGLLQEVADYHGPKALKIAPDTNHDVLRQLIELCQAYDINTIVSGNTLKHTATIDGTQVLSVEAGGQSGSPLTTHTFAQVEFLTGLLAADEVPIGVIACGGVLTADSANRLLGLPNLDEVQVATLYWTQGENGVAKLVTETGLLS